jgi:hypothetical protein
VIAVGAPGDEAGGVGGAGAVHLFDASTGALLRTIPNPEPAAGDEFGYSVATVGAAIAAGSPGDDAGAIHVFEQDGTRRLTLQSPRPGAGGGFGHAVASFERPGAGPRLLVGAPFEEVDGAGSAGAAYVFDPASGEAELTILNPDPEPGDEFGFALSALERNILVGAPGDDIDGAADAGSIHVFDGRDGAELLRRANPAPAEEDRFGHAASACGRDPLVAAPGKELCRVDEGRTIRLNGNLRPLAGDQALETAEATALPTRTEIP